MSDMGLIVTRPQVQIANDGIAIVSFVGNDLFRWDAFDQS